MKNNQSDLDTLYESLNYYYGEGSEERIRKIVEEKIRKIQAGIRLPFEDLIDNFKPIGVETMAVFGSQFPNYPLTAFLYRHEDPFYRILSTLELRVSLLTKYFTLFYCQSLMFKGLIPAMPLKEGLIEGMFTGRKRPTLVNIISNVNYELDNDEHFYNRLMDLSYRYFPDHKFIDPMVLFETPVSGMIQYGSLDEDPSSDSLYSFLFSHKMVGKIVTVKGKRLLGPFMNIDLKFYPPDYAPGLDLTQDEE